jgi:Transposase
LLRIVDFLLNVVETSLSPISMLRARKNLKILLAANKRLNTAYVLKESFGQLWDYNREAWARKFFENWRDQLKWQRLKRKRCCRRIL